MALVATGADWIDLVYWRGQLAGGEIRRLSRTSNIFQEAWTAMRPSVEAYCRFVRDDCEPPRAPWQNLIMLRRDPILDHFDMDIR